MLASRLHAADRRQREPYASYLLRVTIRILSHYRVTDPDVACAALLHDAVEDHAAGIDPGGRPAALAVLAGRFGDRTAALVAAVTNPGWEPGRDKHEQYREHVLASLAATPWARVIKASDFTDNAVGIIHLTGPKLSTLARKYGPLVPPLRELILRPDTPLEADVKNLIAAQLNAAQVRFAAIGQARHGDTGPSALTVSGFDVTVIVLAVLAEPLILLGMFAGLVKLGLLTAHLHKPDKPPTCER